MSPQSLQTSLLRPPALYILRAAGFHSTRSSVADAVANLAARYLLVLASTTAGHWESRGERSSEPQLEDVRRALEEWGAFRPQLHATEEEWRGEEDLRGVGAFVDWFTGEANREIQRIAGMGKGADTLGLGNVQLDELNNVDFLTVLKRRHGKNSEELRYQGTVLGASHVEKTIRIEGGPADNIQAWMRQEGRSKSAPAVIRE